MKAVVFAAGKGTRLKPFTDHHPKALAPIGDTTALGMVIDRLLSAGADHIYVNVHHFADQVISYLHSQYKSVSITISDESDCLLETGGALVKLWREHLSVEMNENEILLVHNADIITDFPIKEMTQSVAKADAAILVDPGRKTSRKFLFDRKGYLTGWINNSTGQIRPEGLDTSNTRQAAFDGVHCLKRSILKRLDKYCGGELKPFSITDFYIENCSDRLSVKAFTPARKFSWFDIGTPERLETASKAYDQGLLKI